MRNWIPGFDFFQVNLSILLYSELCIAVFPSWVVTSRLHQLVQEYQHIQLPQWGVPASVVLRGSTPPPLPLLCKRVCLTESQSNMTFG